MTTEVRYDALEVTEAYSRHVGTPVWLLLDTRFKGELAKERRVLVWLLVRLSGLTLGAVAEHLDISPRSVQRWFREAIGEARVSGNYRERLGDAESAVRRILHNE